MAEMETSRKVLPLSRWKEREFEVPVKSKNVAIDPGNQILDLSQAHVPRTPVIPGKSASRGVLVGK